MQYCNKFLLILIYPVRGHGTIYVGNSCDFGKRVNLRAGQTIRIPAAVFAFMMLDGNDCGYFIFGGITYNLISICGMAFDLFIFFFCELGRLVQDLRRNHALTDIMKETSFTCLVGFFMRVIQPECNIVRQHTYLHGMVVCIVVFLIKQQEKGDDILLRSEFVHKRIQEIIHIVLVKFAG
ncbi:hypothetical protein D3C81_1653730 [compost metagenome]